MMEKMSNFLKENIKSLSKIRAELIKWSVCNGVFPKYDVLDTELEYFINRLKDMEKSLKTK